MQTQAFQTTRGYSVRQWGTTAVIEDDRGSQVHRSAFVPARVVEDVAERAFGRELSDLLTRMALAS